MMEHKIIDICDELKQNFIDFAYEANSQRAFPDARDGLKPGQRACLWEFFIKGYLFNKPHVKSAKIAGAVVANWWPHGDGAIYETFTRMSQPWINNIPEVDWHGSNGNIVIGPEAASSRYTEARLNKPIEEGMFGNIKKNVVPMILNFSEDDEWPEVLPAIFPRLMVNGSQGIGVTVAQTWLPNNLKEISNIVNDYLATGNIDYSLIAPDFPTGGIIINKDELSSIYKTGKGKAVVRAKTEIKNNTILITELPYQVYVEPLIEEIKALVEKEEIKGIEEIYNKTDKKRLLIEIECSNAPLSVLTKLFSLTNLQKSFSANQFALVSKTPKLLNLKEYLDLYINHNIECIIKEYEHDLNKAKARLEIVEGLLKALEDIDNIITLIKQSESAAAAKINLQTTYDFTDNQAKAIVDMKLGRLAHLEYVELNNEKTQLISDIADYENMINSKDNLQNEFLRRLNDFTKKYGTDRKTQLTQIAAVTKEEKEIEAVEPEKCVVIMTESGNIKRIPATSFKTQKRNGKGVKTQDDITNAVIRTNTIDSLMIFTNKGQMYRLLVNDIPEGTNTTKGVSVKSLVEMAADENPSTIYSIYRDTDAKYVLFVTKNGIVKKTSLDEYVKTKKKSGLAAISLREGDELADVSLIKDEELLIITKNGMSIRFKSSDVSASSRVTVGLKGINLGDGDCVIAALPIRDKNDKLAVFATDGLGKKMSLDEFPIQNRGGKGLICYKTSASNSVSDACLISNDDTILVVGDKTNICISGADVPDGSRAALGNMIIKGSRIMSVSKV